MKLVFMIALLSVLSWSSNVLCQRSLCAKEGTPCKYGFGKLSFTRVCCSGMCVDDTCRAFSFSNSNTTNKDPRLPQLQDRCEKKLESAACGSEAVTVMGQYCVCGCPQFRLNFEKFGESCVPSTDDRRAVVLSCREYTRIQDCPAYIALYSNSRCTDIKQKMDQECDNCGGTCVGLMPSVNQSDIRHDIGK